MFNKKKKNNNNSFITDSRMVIFGHRVALGLLCALVSTSIRSDNILMLKLSSKGCLPSRARPPLTHSLGHTTPGAEWLEEKDEVCK